VKHRTGWQYAVAGLTIASIAAVVSYNDGLFVARLAGNHDHQAYLYPFLPDGLFVIGLLALVEGARMRPPQRSAWAWAAVLLGITLSTAMNVGAGVAHSVLDAFLDGMVPVVLLIAVEVVLWHVRRGRKAVEDVAGETPISSGPAGSPATITETVRVTEDRPPSEWLDGKIMSLLARMSVRSTAEALGVSKTRVETAKRRAALTAPPYQIPEREVAPIMTAPAGDSPDIAPAPAGASLNGHGSAHG